METIEIYVSQQVISRCGEAALVAGEVGVHGVHITYDMAWDKVAAKIICFTGPGCSVAVEDTGGAIPIPWETLTKPGVLDIGVVGYDAGGALVITTRVQTTYASRIRIYPKTTSDGELPPPSDPRPELWERVLASIGALGDLQVESKNNLVAAINEVLAKLNAKGATFIPSVSEEGVISWQNDGGLPNPAPRSVKGAQGIPGPRGEAGMNGVALSAEGIYAFNVNADGHLVVSYTGNTPPAFAINADGHLIYNF